MSPQGTRRALALLGIPLVAVLGLSWAADDPAPRVPEGRQAVAPVAPDLPGGVVAGLQAGKYAEAADALAKLADDPKAKPEDRAFYALVRGIAQRLDKKLDAARATLDAAVEAAPQGPWAAKLRSELAAVALAAGRFEDAERLARAEAERLLGGDRKDRLARVYQDFAERLLDPDSPTTPADPEGAYALLNQARELAQGEALRARLLLAMGRASLKAGNPGRALGDFQKYLDEYPKGADRFEARFAKAEAQLATGQVLPARLTWSDLARDLEDEDTRAAQDLRARSLYQIAKTYNLPSPPDDTSLNLGVAALKALLEAYPAHHLALQSAYEIAQSYQNRGRSEAALAAFEAFLAGEGFEAATDEARRSLAELQMAAQFQVGLILRGQEKFDAAIDAWRGYLAKYPNGPQSADAQRAIVDTRLMIAQDHLAHERYDRAREVWRQFVAENPLDGRVPQVLFDIGASLARQEKYDEAIAAWETLAGKFPGTEPAAHAQYQIALAFEVEKGKPAEAIERYKKVQVEPWAGQARQRIAVMEARALTVVTPKAFRTGQTPQLKIDTRNLEKLTFTAYKLDPEAYFRKKHALEDVEALDIGLVQPDAEWTVNVPGYEKYRPIEQTYGLDKLDVPGVYVVKVTDEKTLQATTLVLGSDLDAIVKVSRDQILVFAQDMKTGAGRPNARVLVSDGEKVVFEGKTGDDGVMLETWSDPREPGQALDYLVLDDGHVAGSGLGVPQRVAQGLSARAYLYTDRPAYRPGSTVELRGVVREVKDGQYRTPEGQAYRLEVFDSRGRQFVAREVELSAFGTFHADLPVDSSAPVGSYRVRLYQPGGSDFSGSFEVQAYQLQKVDLAIDLPRAIYFRGEKVEGDAVARYQYGTPLANRPINVGLPDGRVLTGQTDDAGKFHFEFATEGYAEEQALQVGASLPQDGVSAVAQVQIAVRAFRIDLNTARDVYLDGESFPLEIATLDALGEPTSQALNVAVLKQVAVAGRVTEREVKSVKARTDEKTGKATVPIRIDDEDGGQFVVRVSGTDRFGNPVVADRVLTISGSKDAVKLRLLADRLTWKVGETAKVKLFNRDDAGPALLTWEADRILKYKILPIDKGDNEIAWDVEGGQFPNFTLTAARMAGTEFHQAALNVQVVRDLRVQIKPLRPSVGPGEEVEVEVTTLDQLDRPVAAELSLALVDQALLRLYNDNLPPIGPFFYDQARTGAFSTEATNTFAYRPPTKPVSEAVVEEQERSVAMLADADDRVKLRRELGFGVNGPVAGMPATEPMEAKDNALFDRMHDDASGALPAMSVPGSGPAGVGGGGMGAQHGYYSLSTRAGQEMVGAEEFAERFGKEAGAAAKKPATLGRRARFGGRGGEAEGAAASPRQQFVETAYWNPAVVTGPDGKAVVKFKAPTALSEYRFSARGVTGADTLVGQATAELAVRQDFFVDLRLPAALTEGDKPRFRVELHHRGVEGRATLALKVYAGGDEKTLPATVDLKGEGVESILLPAFEVPAGDVVQLALEATAGDLTDRLAAEVPIRPWGVQAFATASGTSSDDTTAFVGLPEGRPYENPEMIVVLSPSLRRLVVELALGQEFYILDKRVRTCILPPTPDTTADRASDLLAVASAYQYLRDVGGSDAPEASRLADRGRGLAAELITGQNDDGGWPWVAAAPDRPQPSDRLTTARALWALSEARALGLVADPSAIDKAATYLAQEFARVESGDNDARAAILHALSTADRAGFEQANSLNRLRQNLSDAALAYLALTFAELDRQTLAAEVLGVLAPRAKTEAVEPGGRPRKYWDGDGQHPWLRSAAETTGLAALAFARSRPEDPTLAPAVDWLLAHRIGTGWQPHKAKGPAVDALATFYGRGQRADDNYRLVVTVNDEEVYRADIQGQAEGKALRVPLAKIKPAGNNRVHFDIEGRGTFGYAVTLTGFARDFGPDQDRNGKTFGIDRRVYLAADPEFEGRPLPTGFGSVVNPQPFENKVGQVALGGRARVSLDAYRVYPADRPQWDREFLILEEHLPAGTTLVEGSVNTSASRFELADGVLTFYFTPDQYPGQVSYDVYGYLPGEYRALPAKLRSAYDPGRYHLGSADNLAVLPPGEKPTDPYKPTPDELLARGKALFEAGRLAEAAGPLESLWRNYTLNEPNAKDVARMLLKVHIQNYDPRKVVDFFEILKEKSPELFIPFDDIKVVGRAYADIGEHERAYLVWRAMVEASYLEDARVGEALRQRGETLESVALLLDLWREYPGSASIRSDFFGISQILASLAAHAFDDADLRRQLAEAEVSRADLLAQEVRLILAFLALSPDDPVADEASLALVGAYFDLEDYRAVVDLAARFAALYPKSRYQDSFVYSEALARFNLGQYDEAIGLAERVAKATTKDANGVEQPSPNKWQALYILGQIHDARHQPAEAVKFYEQVADRFSEAASAVKSLTRRELELPEVAVVRPEGRDAVAGGVNLRAIPPLPRAGEGGDGDEDEGQDEGAVVAKDAERGDIDLTYRNLTEVDVKVYAVDLMRLYLERRTLDDIAGIDLAGIRPLAETTVKLGDGLDYDEKTRGLDLPIEKDGAYLVMARGQDLYASGIVLVSPLELEVLEEPESGRVRVRVRDARTGAFVPRAQVKVIGSSNPTFISGETDLRGVFVAEGVTGEVTAVARHDTAEYAFYRGHTFVGQPPAAPAAADPAAATPPPAPAQAGQDSRYKQGQQGLQQNLRDLNSSNQLKQIERLQQRYNAAPAEGVQINDAAAPVPQP
jgi:uncharacterized protein YfaS (alpha-2-macroglobulin family)/tetratricopeptide (TPR) repeat protein